MMDLKVATDEGLEQDDEASLQSLKEAAAAIRAELSRVIVGQTSVVDELLIGLFARGHCLLVGVPGLAKTLLVRTLAQCLSLDYSRIQFTPDLMPSDITGTEVIQEDRRTGEREFRFVRGPVFANIILADEINRAPPKTQAALLEAMQEQQVTAAGRRHGLPSPFFVLATQNPLEHEGTYPLPEAQLDRFMFQIKLGYPSEKEELEIVRRTTADDFPIASPTIDGEGILRLMRVVRRIPTPQSVAEYAIRMVRKTRREEADAPEFINHYLEWGAGPRASQYLVLAGKARAALAGRLVVEESDIQAAALPVLRHRLKLSFSADAEGHDADKVIQRLLEETPGTLHGQRLPSAAAQMLRPPTAGKA
jgi:MoxR-like ATPase